MIRGNLSNYDPRGFELGIQAAQHDQDAREQLIRDAQTQEAHRQALELESQLQQKQWYARYAIEKADAAARIAKQKPIDYRTDQFNVFNGNLDTQYQNNQALLKDAAANPEKYDQKSVDAVAKQQSELQDIQARAHKTFNPEDENTLSSIPKLPPTLTLAPSQQAIGEAALKASNEAKRSKLMDAQIAGAYERIRASKDRRTRLAANPVTKLNPLQRVIGLNTLKAQQGLTQYLSNPTADQGQSGANAYEMNSKYILGAIKDPSVAPMLGLTEDVRSMLADDAPKYNNFASHKDVLKYLTHVTALQKQAQGKPGGDEFMRVTNQAKGFFGASDAGYINPFGTFMQAEQQDLAQPQESEPQVADE